MKGPAHHHTQIKLQEYIAILINSLVIGFILSFRNWGTDTFDAAQGIQALIYTFVIAFIVLFLRLWIQKKIALHEGYFITYEVSKYSLPISIFLAFFTKGFFIPTAIVSAGKTSVKESHRLRLGSFRYGLNLKDLSKIALAGTLVPVLLMIVVRPIAEITQSFFVFQFILVCAAIGVWGLLPIPGEGGFDLLYHKRGLWLFSFIFVGVYFSLIIYSNIFSYVVATVAAGLATWAYIKFLD